MAAITVAAVASTFNLPNYLGPLYFVGNNANVFSGLVGALAPGGGRVEDQYEFAINTEELPAASQPAILEGAAIPAASSYGMTHARNVTQIFDYAYGVTYSKTASFGRLAHADQDAVATVITAGAAAADPDPFARQARMKLMKMRRDLNYSFINGTYANPADPTSNPRKMRGILACIDAANVISAAAELLTKEMLNNLLQQLWVTGALDQGGNVVIMCNAYQKRRISELYGYAPFDRNVGGLDIKQIETDFGAFPVVMERDMPTTVVAVINLSVCTPVYNLIRNPRTGEVKGVVFSEPVAVTTTEYKDHLYAEIGLDHGPSVWHGKITDLLDATPDE